MPRGLRPKRAPKKVAPGARKSAGESLESATFDELMARAEVAIDRMQLEDAIPLLDAALKQKPDDVAAMDTLGEVLFNSGDTDRARAVLTRSIALCPDGAFTNYTYLAQLVEGEHAVRAYEKAAALLGAALSGAAPTTASVTATRRQLSAVFCSLSELYMTDLCDEEGAEATCERYATQAVEVDGSNPEAYATLANFRLCQSRPTEAPPLLRRAVELIEAAFRTVDQDEEDDDDDEEGEEAGEAAHTSGDMEVDRPAAASALATTALPDTTAADEMYALLPSYDFRMGLARTCMEAEVYDAASTLLDRLLAQDDSNMEAWYLAGEAMLLSGQPAEAVERLQTGDAILQVAIDRARAASKRAGKGGSPAKAAKGSATATSSKQVKGAAAARDVLGLDDGLNSVDLDELLTQQSMIHKLLDVAKSRTPAGDDGRDAAGAPADAGMEMD